MKNFLKIFGATALSVVLILGGLHLIPSAKAQSSSAQLFQTINGFAPVPTGIPFHIVTGTQALTAGAATVTFAGNAVFTSATSYVCEATDQTAAAATKATTTNGTTLTLAGTTTDVIAFVCAGN